MATPMMDQAEREVAGYAAFPREAPPDLPEKPTLRPDEVARILGVSEKHVRHLVEEGSLKEAVDVRSAICSKPSLRVTARSVVEFWNRRRV